MIVLIIISWLLVILAGAAKAAADIVRDHFTHSVFKTKPEFWDPEISWKNKYINGNPAMGFKNKFKHPQTFSDGWHTMNFFFMLCLLLAAVSLGMAGVGKLFCLAWGIIAGILLMISFNECYNHIFVDKKKN